MRASQQVMRPPMCRSLTTITLMLSLFSGRPMPISAQTTSSSPRSVLQAYREMDAAGERLNVGGWSRAYRFFVRPEPPPENYVISVIEGERIDDHPQREGSRAEIAVMCSAVGQIDASARFTRIVAPRLADSSKAPSRQLGTQQINGPAPLMRQYQLVLTNNHWEFGPNLKDLRRVNGAPEWRIETFESEPWVTIPAAIRYLLQLRGNARSDVARNNAAQSIALLQSISSDKGPRR